MHCLRVPAAFAVFLGVLAIWSLAEESELTADEFVVNAASFYENGRYSEAAELYQRFIAEFGAAPDAQIAIRQTYYPLAICLLRLQRFAEAYQAIKDALEKTIDLDRAQAQELLFWKGVCEINQQHAAEARKTLEEFLSQFPPALEGNAGYARQFPAVLRIPEARLLVGACLLQEGRPGDAADYYAQIKSTLAPTSRGRATVLQLHALVEAGKDDEALKVVKEEFSRMGELLQLVTFQSLTFELGSRYLERNRPREAIMCLQRIWRANRLLEHQQARLEDLKSQLQAAETGPRGDPYARILFEQLISKLKREIENFRKIENFDVAVRLRLAAVYQAMHRYREAALILERMIEELPPDPLVESAAANLVQSWFAIEAWTKVIEAANTFTGKFSKSAQIPLIRYLQGIAEQRNGRYREATNIFASLCHDYATSEYAPRARFMAAFSLLQAEENRQAIAEFERFEEHYPEHDLREDALYWRGMGLSLQRDFVRAREVMDLYLGTFKSGRYYASATFRKAYCAQQTKDYQTSIRELESFLREHSTAVESDEARILLGDAMIAQGRLEEAVVVFRSISKENVQLHTEAVFKIGKVFRLTEQDEKFLRHMAQFKAENPRSPRVAEALYWIGWVHRQQGFPERAREVYWAALSEYGNDATIQSVEDLFPAILKLYQGDDEQAKLCTRLRNLRLEAEQTGKKTLATRAAWAEAVALRRRDPAQAQSGLVEVAKRLNVQTDNPIILADCGDALLGLGREQEAEDLYRDLIRWNPRAAQKDRALATLGKAEMRRGDTVAALQLFERFEREIVGSRLLGEVMISRAHILQASGRLAESREVLEQLLASEYPMGKEKAEALYLIGDAHMRDSRPDLAIPYFQRVYVMYGRWRDWVAKAYYRSGEAFEKLNDELSARKTYQELTEREDLTEFEETSKARRRLDLLRGSSAIERGRSTEG